MTEHEQQINQLIEKCEKELADVERRKLAMKYKKPVLQWYDGYIGALKKSKDLLTQAHTQWKAGLKKEIEDLDGDGIETASDQWILRADVLALPSLQDTEKETDAS